MKKMMFYLLAFLMIVGMSATQAAAEGVDLELSLVVDVSGSVDATDFALQRNGYVNAFRDATIINGIVNGGTYHSIAVNLVYFSDSAAQSIGWTKIYDSVSANAFADLIAAAARPFSGGTGIVNALNYAFPLFTNNGFEGTRLVIDVSGDGSESEACSSSNSVCVALQSARNAALQAGITTINGLAIYDRNFYGAIGSGANIEAIPYLQNNLIGGTGAFAIAANDFDVFEATVKSKLSREIIGTPEPLTLLLLGLGLTGLAGLRRRFEK